MHYYHAILFSLAFNLLDISELSAKQTEVYSSPDGIPLSLDIYSSNAEQACPVVVWIHGGGWNSGSKNDCPLKSLTANGYSVVSVDYRLTTVAKFPAQIIDCKNAIRWIKTNAHTYHLDPSRIVVIGFSAGGQLAALLGTNPDPDTKVKLIVDGFGSTDFNTLADSNNPKVQKALTMLFGQPLNTELMREASPINYVARGDPSFLILHAVHDGTVPIEQSEIFAKKLKDAGVPVVVYFAPTGDHGPNPLYPPVIKEFLSRNL